MLKDQPTPMAAPRGMGARRPGASPGWISGQRSGAATLAAFLLWGAVHLTAPAPAAAQPAPEARPRTVLHAFTLRHQSATEAIGLVRPLLSLYGTVELQPATNTLVVRDTLAALNRIVPMLKSFDHPSQPVRMEIQIVEAARSVVSPATPSELPDGLTRKLRELLRYDHFALLARADLRTREGEEVIYDLGSGYRVSFRLGTILADRRLKLHGFKVVRVAGAPGTEGSTAEILHAHLTLWVEQPLVLALAQNEGSDRALMVILTCFPLAATPAGGGS